MRRPPRNLADAREELVQIEQEFVRLQKRIETVRDSVADLLLRLFGEERPAFAGLQEEAFIEKIAARVVSRLEARPKAQAQGDKRYVRYIEAAAFLGVSVFSTPKLEGQDGGVFSEGVGAICGRANRCGAITEQRHRGVSLRIHPSAPAPALAK